MAREINIAQTGLRVVIVDNPSELDGLENQWDALFLTSPSATPPLRWKWVTQWWHAYGDQYGDGGAGLRIITIYKADRLIGILPLYEGYQSIAGFKIRRLTFITAGAAEFEETSVDYLDLLYAPGEEASCLTAIAGVLRNPRLLRWDQLHLPSISHQSPLPSLFGKWRHARSVERGHCHLFDMNGGFESYLLRLSGENRRQARKALREVEKEGLQFEIAKDPAQADMFFDQMVQLHRSRWTSKGKAGSFSPRHAAFHRAVLLAGVASGDVIIARLCKGQSPLAVIYAHRVGAKLHCMQQGVNTENVGRVRSPGNAAWLLLMRYMADHGITLFDHLKGTTTFKERYGTGTHVLVEVQAVRMNLRWMSYCVARFCVRVLRRLGKMADHRGTHAADPSGPGSNSNSGADSVPELAGAMET